jgi:predicted nucleotidyltransferase
MTSKELQKNIIETIVRYKRPEKIVIFGSRAQGNSQKTSDIDIAIFGKDWTDKDINLIKFNLDENIKTPLKFDVLNFYTLTKERLKDNILKEGEVIYECRED